MLICVLKGKLNIPRSSFIFHHSMKSSELILNPNGSIYHLHLRPEQVAPTIITVGDPDRVARVSQHFDRIDHKVHRREFVTHTGELNGKRLSVISTGIGPDNIDIVLNELDALMNVDFETRKVKEKHTRLEFIRLGTSGALQPDLPVDSFLVSTHAAGLDNLAHYYLSPRPQLPLENALKEHLASQGHSLPQLYAAPAANTLVERLSEGIATGVTLTAPGFYGPQGRSIRLQSRLSESFFQAVQSFSFQGHRITNFEMESSAIFVLSAMLGHRAVSVNALLANRANGTFSQQPRQSVDQLIRFALERIV